MSTSPEPHAGRGSLVAVLVVCLLLGPIIYAASIGPAVWLVMFGYERGWIDPDGLLADGVEAVYFPVLWTAEACGSENLLTGYIEWWID